MLLFGCGMTVHAQQWIDQNYSFEPIEDILFGTAVEFNGQTDSLYMDLYLPECGDPEGMSRRPLLICIHGGGFIEGSYKDQGMKDICETFARRGYVTASIGYRLGYIFDELPWDCSIENYSCLFATDFAEWERAYYRGVQDAKGALRYLLNRNDMYRIDTANVFVMGESAGAFIALGVGLLDSPSERPSGTFEQAPAPAPNPLMYDCLDQTYSGEVIARPDLGPLEGSIEPTTVNYTIKGIGNMFGAMFKNLLHEQAASVKPVIYSYHQPCDLLVPLDSAAIYWGLSWCMTNGYNCYGFANTPIVYGSRTIRDWNEANSYGFTIQSDFTSVEFPFSFLFGQASCYDQAINPGAQCHAYDNRALRLNHMAELFATAITTSPVCDPEYNAVNTLLRTTPFTSFPNPAGNTLQVRGDYHGPVFMTITDLTGSVVEESKENFNGSLNIHVARLARGAYLLRISDVYGNSRTLKFMKN